MKTVAQVARQAGISVRTLQYYDKIGLLKPDEITPAGYRLYGSKSLERLQHILFFRELDFPLAQIKAMLAAPGADTKEVLLSHLTLLGAKKRRLEKLIGHVKNLLKGEDTMDFDAFDTSEINGLKEEYAKEAQQRWGRTPAFAQSEARTKKYTQRDWQAIKEAQQEIYDEFAALIDGGDPGSPAAQAAVAKWQAHISKYFYDCDDEILAGLGEMYAGDERFRQNIDKTRSGLAAFMAGAIQAYCGK